MGLDPAAVERIDVLSERHGHALWRVVKTERSYILKWLPEQDARVEIEGYRLLHELGVPTLPLYGNTAQALLLEDLARSERWRLAVEADAARAGVGRAVARWYRILHDAGEALLAAGDGPGFLTRESDVLNPEAILAIGPAVGLANHRVWNLAADHVELLKAAVEKLSVTLNYNDFYWTNLALSRETCEPEAIVFDYHLLGVGMRYSDCRNVTGSLSGGAVGAFWDSYGPVDPRERILDRPLATLYGLAMGTRRSEFPRWAESSRERVIDGGLERDLIEAVTLARALCGPKGGRTA
jgi:hypothetical protein